LYDSGWAMDTPIVQSRSLPMNIENRICLDELDQKVLNRNFKSTLLILGLSLTVASSAWSQDPPSNADKRGTLDGQATVLRNEAAKLDQSMQAFNLHAATYNRSKIHQLVLQHQNPATAKSKTKLNSKQTAAAVQSHQEASAKNSGETQMPGAPLTPETPQLTPAELQSRIETVHKLHEQFESHVTQLRDLVDQYHNFYNLYSTHYDQFKGQLQDYKLEAEKAQLDLSKPKFNLGATKQATNLAGAENNLAVVLKKMIALEEESPNLSENYLCPAFDDLQKEFVVALAGLTTSIQALPPDQVRVVAKTEVEQIQLIKTEMEDAERLHEEQIRLKNEYVTIQKDYAAINAKHAKLAKESASDEKRIEGTDKLIEKRQEP
jgi:hypothetical protein